MRLALLHARRAEGRSGTNPPIGCALISKQNRLLAYGCTGADGVPHAEISALSKLCDPKAIRGGTAFITLEPCAHHGKTPPCADALIEAGLARVVCGCLDPDPRTNGKGAERLKKAGISVDVGLLAEACRASMAGFLSIQQRHRPTLTTKIATSADGFIAKTASAQTWLTGPAAQTYAQDLRSRHDAILSGISTILSDDPTLNCRPPFSPADSPARLIADSDMRLSPDSKIARTAQTIPTHLYCREPVCPQKAKSLEALGIKIHPIIADATGLNMRALLESCMHMGFHSILIEAGTKLNKTLLEQGLIDRLIHICAPHHLEAGYASIAPVRARQFDLAFAGYGEYKHKAALIYGEDHMHIWERDQEKG